MRTSFIMVIFQDSDRPVARGSPQRNSIHQKRDSYIVKKVSLKIGIFILNLKEARVVCDLSTSGHLLFSI